MANPISSITLCDTVLEEAISNVNQAIVIEKYLLQKAKHVADSLADFPSNNPIQYEELEE